MDMLDILFYTDTPGYGGAERQMELLAKYLKKFGFTVHLACGEYSQLTDRKTELLSVYETVHVLPAIHKHDPRHYFSLNKLLRNGRYKAVHLHLWNPGACRYAFFAVKRHRLPVIVTEHDFFELNGLKLKLKRKCQRRTDRMIAINMDNIDTVSSRVQHLKSRIHLVHNGIDIDNYIDNMDTVSSPVQHEKVRLISVAELHPRKGQKTLIQAFQRLKKRYPKLQLQLVGRGPYEAELKKLAQNEPDIHFLGWRDDIPKLLKDSDLFILPSEREAFGLVVLEAMAAGVAVIATETAGARETVLDGKTGLLVPPSNPEMMAKAIETLILNPAQKRDLERAALERVKKEFTAERMAEKTAEVYRKALS